MTSVAAGTLTMNGDTIIAGMGELYVSSSPSAVLACIGLGSCIALFAYDPIARIGGIVHIVLPRLDKTRQDGFAKYADTAVPLLIEEVIKVGAARKRLTFKMAGGAQMTIAPGLSNTFKMGDRNRLEVIAALEREKMTLVSADTGGSKGRTASMYVENGRVFVKTVGGVAREL